MITLELNRVPGYAIDPVTNQITILSNTATNYFTGLKLSELLPPIDSEALSDCLNSVSVAGEAMAKMNDSVTMTNDAFLSLSALMLDRKEVPK